MPGDCLDCGRRVAKNAKALRCALCKEWCHATCGGLQDGDYLFMTNRGKLGFRWYCMNCIVDADDNESRGKAVNEMKENLKKLKIS